MACVVLPSSGFIVIDLIVSCLLKLMEFALSACCLIKFLVRMGLLLVLYRISTYVNDIFNICNLIKCVLC